MYLRSGAHMTFGYDQGPNLFMSASKRSWSPFKIVPPPGGIYESGRRKPSQETNIQHTPDNMTFDDRSFRIHTSVFIIAVYNSSDTFIWLDFFPLFFLAKNRKRETEKVLQGPGRRLNRKPSILLLPLPSTAYGHQAIHT